MTIVSQNIFEPLVAKKDQSFEFVDIFSVSGKKSIELSAHSSLTYLIVVSGADIDLRVVTKGPQCSCQIFGLFASDAKHPISGSLTVSLDHSQTSAEVELISFLRD